MKTIFALIVSFTVLGCLASGQQAAAQQPLERIEGQIRSQTSPASPGAPKAQATGDRPYLGAQADDKNDRGRGVRILAIRPGGPAEQAGLRPQDLITGAATARVRQMSDLTAILEMFAPGERLSVEVLRDGQTQKVDVTLGRFPGAIEPARQGVPPSTLAPPAAGPAAPAPSTLLAPPSIQTAPPSTQVAPPSEGPVANLGAPPTGPMNDSARIEQLQRRIEQLEQRVQDLEKALSDSRKK